MNYDLTFTKVSDNCTDKPRIDNYQLSSNKQLVRRVLSSPVPGGEVLLIETWALDTNVSTTAVFIPTPRKTLRQRAAALFSRFKPKPRAGQFAPLYPPGWDNE